MKVLKKLLVCLLVLSMLTGCGGSKTPKDAATSFLKAVKKGDAKALTKVYYGEVESSTAFAQNLKNEFAKSDTYKSMMSNGNSNLFSELDKDFLDFDYDVIEILENGSQATATVVIKTRDWQQIGTDFVNVFVPKAFVMLIDGKSEKKIKNAFEDWLKDEKKSVRQISTNISMPLVKTDEGWKVDASDLMDPLFQAIIGVNY